MEREGGLDGKWQREGARCRAGAWVGRSSDKPTANSEPLLGCVCPLQNQRESLGVAAKSDALGERAGITKPASKPWKPSTKLLDLLARAAWLAAAQSGAPVIGPEHVQTALEQVPAAGDRCRP
jgi:hypothetical protein